jgi:hypothetical protein
MVIFTAIFLGLWPALRSGLRKSRYRGRRFRLDGGFKEFRWNIGDAERCLALVLGCASHFCRRCTIQWREGALLPFSIPSAVPWRDLIQQLPKPSNSPCLNAERQEPGGHLPTAGTLATRSAVCFRSLESPASLAALDLLVPLPI